MEHKAKSIRPFIGAKNFKVSREFYTDLGFIETVILPNLSLFQTGIIGFYLQDANVKEWIDNTMIFLEIENIADHYNEILALNLPSKYQDVKLIPVRVEHWGKEYFLHDPSGILWHFGEFYR